MQKIIKAKGMVDVNQQILIPDITIVIDNDIITSVESGITSAQTDPEAQVVDLSDQYILPGLINSHMHLCMPGDSDFGQNPAYQKRAVLPVPVHWPWRLWGLPAYVPEHRHSDFGACLFRTPKTPMPGK